MCPDVDYLKITPLEHVLLETEWDPRDLDRLDIKNTLRYWSETRSERVSILKCERKWMKKLKSIKPYVGIYLPYHLQFKLYMDETPAITKLVKSCYKQLQIGSGSLEYL